MFLVILTFKSIKKLKTLPIITAKYIGIWFLKFVGAWPKSQPAFSWNGTVGWLMVPHVGGMGFSVIGPFVLVWPEKLQRSSCNLPRSLDKNHSSYFYGTLYAFHYHLMKIRHMQRCKWRYSNR